MAYLEAANQIVLTAECSVVTKRSYIGFKYIQVKECRMMGPPVLHMIPSTPRKRCPDMYISFILLLRYESVDVTTLVEIQSRIL